MTRRQRAHLVTAAAVSRGDERRRRQRRYALTMAARVVLLVTAAIVARFSVPLAIGTGALSAVLPWFAVVMANDRPPRSSRAPRTTRATSPERALTASGASPVDRRVIVAGGVVIDEDGATVRPSEGDDRDH